jgi:hypothetical protein
MAVTYAMSFSGPGEPFLILLYCTLAVALRQFSTQDRASPFASSLKGGKRQEVFVPY